MPTEEFCVYSTSALRLLAVKRYSSDESPPDESLKNLSMCGCRNGMCVGLNRMDSMIKTPMEDNGNSMKQHENLDFKIGFFFVTCRSRHCPRRLLDHNDELRIKNLSPN